VQSGVDEGAELTQTQCTLRPKDIGSRRRFSRASRTRIAWRPRNFRAGVECDDVPHAGGGVRACEQHPYGLSAGVWTDKGSKIFKMVNKLRAGVVWANTYNKFDPTSPFGGYRKAGLVVKVDCRDFPLTADWIDMPTVMHIGPYRFFFYAGDRDEPPHVHVERDRSNAKFWLDPVAIAKERRI